MKFLSKIVGSITHSMPEAAETDTALLSTRRPGVCLCDSRDLPKLDMYYAIKIGAALIFFFAALLPVVPAALKYGFLFVSAVIAGYDIALKAIVHLLTTYRPDDRLIATVAAVIAFVIGEAIEGALVILIYQLGKTLQLHFLAGSRSSIGAHLDGRPETVKSMIDNETFIVPASEIKQDDMIVVSPGETVAVDGVVVSGNSQMDLSALMGNKTLQTVAPGGEVSAGSVNISETLTIRATKTLNDSIYGKILDAVSSAENEQSDPEKMIRKAAAVFTPAVFGIALLICILVPVIGGLPFNDWIHRALVILLASCPCAFLFSLPLTYYAGIAGALQKGIVLKSNKTADTLANTASVVFDQTGTLTTGDYQVISLEPVGIGGDELLLLAAYALSISSDRLAQAVVSAGADIRHDLILRAHEEPGMGCIVELPGGRIVAAGNIDLMKKMKIDAGDEKPDEISFYVAIGQNFAGRIQLGDELRPDAAKAVWNLNKHGIDRVVLFTGEQKASAEKIASTLGILEVYPECTVEDKEQKLRNLLEMQMPGDRLAYVGNGDQDATLLSMADAGIAMRGSGAISDLESADVVIMGDEPFKVGTAIAAVKRIRFILMENIAVALLMKLAVILLGIFGFVTMWMAVTVNVLVAFFTLLNALRAYQLSYPLTYATRLLKKRSPNEES